LGFGAEIFEFELDVWGIGGVLLCLALNLSFKLLLLLIHDVVLSFDLVDLALLFFGLVLDLD